jgi:hypothetical protein
LYLYVVVLIGRDTSVFITAWRRYARVHSK